MFSFIGMSDKFSVSDSELSQKRTLALKLLAKPPFLNLFTCKKEKYFCSCTLQQCAIISAIALLPFPLLPIIATNSLLKGISIFSNHLPFSPLYLSTELIVNLSIYFVLFFSILSNSCGRSPINILSSGSIRTCFKPSKVGSALSHVKQLPNLSLLVLQSILLCESLQSKRIHFTPFLINESFPLLYFSTLSDAVKTKSTLFIIVFFSAILVSSHFNSSHSVFPIAVKYLPSKNVFALERA